MCDVAVKVMRCVVCDVAFKVMRCVVCDVALCIYVYIHTNDVLMQKL